MASEQGQLGGGYNGAAEGQPPGKLQLRLRARRFIIMSSVWNSCSERISIWQLGNFCCLRQEPRFATEGTLIILSHARNKQNIAVEIPSVLYCVGVGNIDQRVQITVHLARHTTSEEWGDVGWGGGQHMTGRINSIEFCYCFLDIFCMISIS